MRYVERSAIPGHGHHGASALLILLAQKYACHYGGLPHTKEELLQYIRSVPGRHCDAGDFTSGNGDAFAVLYGASTMQATYNAGGLTGTIGFAIRGVNGPVAVGDFNGDGDADIAIGMPGALRGPGSGVVDVFFGAPSVGGKPYMKDGVTAWSTMNNQTIAINSPPLDGTNAEDCLRRAAWPSERRTPAR